ncbi:tetratricopeptide repeat protein [bacterium]|nr:tetratricopeptide repeat protein [bacterium]
MTRAVRALGILLAMVLAAAAFTGCGGKLDPKLQEGYELVLQGKVDEAIAMANALLADDPRNAEARNLIGLALYKAGDTEGAVAQYLQALEINDKYAEAHFNLGNAYQLLERTDDAEAEFHEAVRHQSKFVQAHFNLAILYRDSGRTEQALREFRACVDQDPQFYYAYLAMGQLQYGLGDMESAVANLGRALELAPAQKELRVLYGNALLRSGAEGAPARAEEEFRAAISIDGSYVDAVYNLAVSLVAQERPEEAKEHFQRVLQLTREDPTRGQMVERVNGFLKDLRLKEEDAAREGTAG